MYIHKNQFDASIYIQFHLKQFLSTILIIANIYTLSSPWLAYLINSDIVNSFLLVSQICRNFHANSVLQCVVLNWDNA